MNTQIINAELQQALRKCLPFVHRHAIISGGDGSLTYAFALRALADADARQQEEQRVKNIIEAKRARMRALQRAVDATLAHARAYSARETRKVLDRFGVRNVRAARPDQYAAIERAMQLPPADSPATKMFVAARFPTTGWISGDEAMKQAARAVRPGEGYLPAAPPAKGCNCDVCTEARLRGMRRAGL